MVTKTSRTVQRVRKALVRRRSKSSAEELKSSAEEINDDDKTTACDEDNEHLNQRIVVAQVESEEDVQYLLYSWKMHFHRPRSELQKQQAKRFSTKPSADTFWI